MESSTTLAAISWQLVDATVPTEKAVRREALLQKLQRQLMVVRLTLDELDSYTSDNCCINTDSPARYSHKQCEEQK